jgi:hypothetical protein
MSTHTTTTVTTLPACDLCTPERSPSGRREALYDGKTTEGPWAYMCDIHFRLFGTGLGLGRGQRLVTDDIPTTLSDTPNKRDLIMAAIEDGDSDAVWDIVGDGDIAEWL